MLSSIRVFLFLILCGRCVYAENVNDSGMLGKLKSGLQLAGKLLRLDAASGIAQLVSDTFGGNAKSNKGETADKQQNLFTGFFRILGLDTGKLSAIAINGLIFLAQLISSSLTSLKPSEVTHERNVKEGSPLEWLLSSKTVKNLVADAKDKSLPDKLIENIQERSMDEESICIQLFVCKITPFIWGMQNGLDKQEDASKIRGSSAMFFSLPGQEEVNDYGDECEKRFPLCVLH